MPLVKGLDAFTEMALDWWLQQTNKSHNQKNVSVMRNGMVKLLS